MSTTNPVLLALAILLLWSVTGAGAAQVTAVWAVNDGEKIKRDDLENPNKARNSVWDGRKISLFGARNEVVAFQVVVQAGPEGVKDVDVTLASLVRKGTGEKLTAQPEGEDPTDWRGGQIERFKNIRRGMQDYEYLWLAAKNGLEPEARAAADACVPRAFSEAKGDVAWSIKGDDWDVERRKLAEALERKLKR